MMDLIKTIEDEEEPSDLSEDSGSEDEFQPTRKRSKTAKSSGLDPGFDFTSFQTDIWSEKIAKAKSSSSKLNKLIGRTTLDQKIKKRVGNKIVEPVAEDLEVKEESGSEPESQSENEVQEDESDSDDSISAHGPKSKKSKKKKLMEDDIELSDSDLQEDEIRLKKTWKNKKNKSKVEEEDDEDEVSEEDKSERLQDSGTDYTIETNLSFQQMNLSRPLLKAVTSLGFVHPTPIQAAAIPVALAGKDICGCAATGTGKTAAYMLPVLERLLYKPKSHAVTRVLCLVPTRELGVQVYRVTKQLCSFSDEIQIGLAVGGLDVQAQEQVLRQNPDIVIATPGRLIDHLGNTPTFTLDSIEILILDEADRMLDDWFAQQLKEIVKQCSPRRQTLLFSATMTDRVKDLAMVSLKNPTKIFVDSNKQVAFNLRQQFVRVRNENDREAILCSLVVRTFHSKTMVFVPTKKIAHRLHILLGLFSIRIGELHGDLSQIERLDALKKFQTGEVDVLIVTDVAARGLDIPGVQSVLNFTMPPTLEQYIHRCGRTARAGRSGIAVSLVGESDRKLMKLVAKSATLPVKARIIPTEMIAKYRDRVKGFQPQIESIMEEEEGEKIIAKAEIQANKTLKLLTEKQPTSKNKKKAKNMVEPGKRNWFQSHKDRMEESERLKGKRPTAADREKMVEAAEDLKIRKIAEFQARDAKRKRRNRGSSTNGMNGNIVFPNSAKSSNQPQKKGKKKSHFENELTNTSAARQFRHQPKVQPTNKADKKFGQKTGKKRR